MSRHKRTTEMLVNHALASSAPLIIPVEVRGQWVMVLLQCPRCANVSRSKEEGFEGREQPIPTLSAGNCAGAPGMAMTGCTSGGYWRFHSKGRRP